MCYASWIYRQKLLDSKRLKAFLLCYKYRKLGLIWSHLLFAVASSLFQQFFVGLELGVFSDGNIYN